MANDNIPPWMKYLVGAENSECMRKFNIAQRDRLNDRLNLATPEREVQSAQALSDAIARRREEQAEQRDRAEFNRRRSA